VGKVVSAKMQKTIVVAVPRVREDRIYSKRSTVQKRYYVEDVDSLAGEGDMVRIRETRPLSKLKRWTLIEVTQKAI
jgi:small subunit ribosomal protein S17